MVSPKVYTVSQINRYIRNIINNDLILQSLWIRGEISNFKKHSSGHLYFTLKDKESVINALMFRVDADAMPYEVENGMEVTICGYVSVYEKTGQYQLYAQFMEPSGIGSLAVAFEQMKKKLMEEGLFDEDYKREISKNPKVVAVITSPTGAAVRDIINIAQRRNKGVQIVIVPTLVQGENAASNIVNSIAMVNKWGKADTIIVGRGGGSIEDLWAFNEEVVARAIFASEIPIISAVGHETDFTIADFVSDLRAPTPSAAAELAINDLEGSLEKVNYLMRRLNFSVNKNIDGRKKYIEFMAKNRAFKGVYENICNGLVDLDRHAKNIEKAVFGNIENSKKALIYNINRLEILSPFATMKRGYCIAFSQEEKIIKSIEDVKEKENIIINVSDGTISAQVKGVEKLHG